MRKTWEEVKRERADSPTRRQGYERAGRTIRLAIEIHQLGVELVVSFVDLDDRIAG